MRKIIIGILFLGLLSSCKPKGRTVVQPNAADSALIQMVEQRIQEKKQLDKLRWQLEQSNFMQHITHYKPIIKKYAKRYGFDYRLIIAQIVQESGFKMHARSRVGARGLMQIMPGTARELSRELDIEYIMMTPRENIAAGIYHLYKQYSYFPDAPKEDRTKLALASYNCGAGRVFDGIAALLGVRAIVSYEGQAAVRLEHLIDDSSADDSIYPFRLSSNGDDPLTVDWENTLLAILEEIAAGRSPALISRRFHNTMSEMIVSVARRYPNRRVVLTGGCFQNRYLLERTIGRLRNEGLTPVYHRGLPPNDGGIAAGQSAVAAAQKRNEYVSRGTR